MVLSCEIITRENFKVENGFHPMDCLIILTEGSFSCEIDGKKYIANKGDIFCFRKNLTFKRKVISKFKAIYIIFDSLPQFESGILKNCFQLRLEENIQFILEKNEDKAVINHYVNDILLCLSQQKPKNQLAEKCINYLKNNYENTITLDMLSKEFNITKQGLIKQFRIYTGTSPIAYLTDLRLKHAKELLISTSLNITEISENCGFDNVYYFSNVFKKHFSVSPKIYRKQMTL